MHLTPVERETLTQLQRGIALAASPFLHYPLPEVDVVRLLRRAQAEGVIRRFGGVFDSRRLGYRSMLCGVAVKEEHLEASAAVICQHPGVTHCYERRPVAGGQAYPLLWFTIAMPEADFDAGLEALQMQIPASEIFRLPALQRFKIDVVFDLRNAGADEASGSSSTKLQGDDPGSVLLTKQEQLLVRLLGGSLPVAEQPFQLVAEQIGMAVPDLLDTLRRWSQQGILRRVAPILFHREAGFIANGMCVWPVAGDVAVPGACVAARPEVTHCYQRTRVPGFAFDLFAMIHAGSEEALRGMFAAISTACSLADGALLLSTREFKKSSMQYFEERT